MGLFNYASGPARPSTLPGPAQRPSTLPGPGTMHTQVMPQPMHPGPMPAIPSHPTMQHPMFQQPPMTQGRPSFGGYSPFSAGSGQMAPPMGMFGGYKRF